MKELSELSGMAIKRSQVDALFRALNGTDPEDFKKAVVSLAESGEKLSLFSLKKHINHFQTERLEYEAAIDKEKELIEITRFWKAHFKEGRCLKHDCGECPKTFCHIVSNACIKSIKDILSGAKTSAQAHSELAEEFPGLGFEQETGEPF